VCGPRNGPWTASSSPFPDELTYDRKNSRPKQANKSAASWPFDEAVRIELLTRLRQMRAGPCVLVIMPEVCMQSDICGIPKDLDRSCLPWPCAVI